MPFFKTVTYLMIPYLTGCFYALKSIGNSLVRPPLAKVLEAVGRVFKEAHLNEENAEEGRYEYVIAVQVHLQGVQ
jgi:hypothetical protein